MVESILHFLDKYFKGLMIIGPTTAPATSMQVTVAGNVGPEASGTRSIGSTTLRWLSSFFSSNVSIGPVSSGGTGLLNTAADAQTNQIVSELASTTASNTVAQVYRRSRGTVTAPATVNSLDFIASLNFEAEAGAGPLNLVRLVAYVISRAASNNASGNLAFQTRPAGAGSVLTTLMELWGNGSVVLGDQAAALATTATDGFLYIRSCAGVPTGVPTAVTGSVPMVYDTTNLRLYVYAGGAWRIH